jgi:hypothetical protein
VSSSVYKDLIGGLPDMIDPMGVAQSQPRFASASAQIQGVRSRGNGHLSQARTDG